MTTKNDCHDQTSHSEVSGSSNTAIAAHKPWDPQAARTVIPQEIRELFGRPPLLNGEDAALYQRMLEELALMIGPKSVMDWLWLKDVADYSWEASRLQRYKAAVVDLNRKEALADVLRKVLHPKKRAEHLDRLADNWFTDPKIKVEGLDVLKTLGLTEDCIDAQAVTNSSAALTMITGLLGCATSRRDAALREIDRRRAEVIDPRNGAETIDGATGEPITPAPAAANG